MTDPTPDWIAFLKQYGETAGDELDLRELKEGDQLRIATKNTDYYLEVVDAGTREVLLHSEREDRPSGKARIMGGTFGMSSSIKPDRLFCGGNLEITLDEGEVTHTTSAIREISLLRREG